MTAIFTIGHSTHEIGEFIELLKAHGITLLVDIRTMPRSKYNPQFNEEALAESLKNQHISYRHIKALGGLRYARADSPNKGFRNGGFRGYADYMQTEYFRVALEQLITLGNDNRAAIMCAESVPWRCHRSLVSDALVVRGIDAQNIFPDGHTKPHALTTFARVEGDRITYPAAQTELL